MAFLPPGELQSLLRKEFRSSDIIFFGGRNATAPTIRHRATAPNFFGGRNATAPTSGTVPPPLIAGFIRF